LEIAGAVTGGTGGLVGPPEPELQLDAPAAIHKITIAARINLERGNPLDIKQSLVFV
jgi:hypothetical protein